jgi:hypothetical protein
MKLGAVKRVQQMNESKQKDDGRARCNKQGCERIHASLGLTNQVNRRPVASAKRCVRGVHVDRRLGPESGATIASSIATSQGMIVNPYGMLANAE